MNDFYASLSAMPVNPEQQSAVLRVMQDSQAILQREGITSSVHAGNLDDEPVEVDGWLYDETRFNEETLVKVKNVFQLWMRNASGIDLESFDEVYANELITALQNAGILFREKLS